MAALNPKCRAVDGLLHLKYKLPQHIHVSKIYPRTSSNGSSVIILGHDRGLTVVWRGGKHLKPALKDNHGKSQDTAEDGMAVDTASDEGPDAEDQEVEFEDEEEEFDPSQPYRSIVQHLNLDIGASILDMAFPRLPPESPVPISPSLLEEKMLIALACADRSVRLLTLPLTPPDPARSQQELAQDDFEEYFTRRADWIDSLITIPPAQCHRSLPSGVSIALTPRPVSSIEGDEGDTITTDASRPSEEWDVLIVSHSADLSGTMLIHKIPISSDGMDIEQPPAEDILWRSERLARPAASVQIYVPTSQSQPDPSKPTPPVEPRVLVAESSGPVRLYECISEADPDRGFWGLTLHPGYATSPGAAAASTPGALSHNRTILDAQWVLGGHAICALLADGEWGIWDLSPSRLAKTIAGSAPTKFTLSGFLSPAPARQLASSKPEPRSSLAPMTPNTRKVRQDALFAKPGASPANGSSITSGGMIPGAVTGGIVPQLSQLSLSGADDDESLLLWHGARTLLIPSLRTHWRTRVKNPLSSSAAADPFGGGAAANPREFPPVDLPGEQRTGAAVFPAHELAAGASGAFRARTQDLLVGGERSFVVVAAPLKEERNGGGLGKSTALVRTGSEEAPAANREVGRADDRGLLAMREVGIDGIDRMLDDMASGSPSKAPGAGKRVGFAM